MPNYYALYKTFCKLIVSVLPIPVLHSAIMPWETVALLRLFLMGLTEWILSMDPFHAASVEGGGDMLQLYHHSSTAIT